MPFFMLVIVNLVILATSVWVVFDSRDRDFSHSRIAKGRAQWIVGSFLLWIVAFPAYLMIRNRSPKSGSAGSAAPAPTPMASMVPPHHATSVPPPDRGTPPAA